MSPRHAFFFPPGVFLYHLQNNPGFLLGGVRGGGGSCSKTFCFLFSTKRVFSDDLRGGWGGGRGSFEDAGLVARKEEGKNCLRDERDSVDLAVR